MSEILCDITSPVIESAHLLTYKHGIFYRIIILWAVQIAESIYPLKYSDISYKKDKDLINIYCITTQSNMINALEIVL